MKRYHSFESIFVVGTSTFLVLALLAYITYGLVSYTLVTLAVLGSVVGLPIAAFLLGKVVFMLADKWNL